MEGVYIVPSLFTLFSIYKKRFFYKSDCFYLEFSPLIQTIYYIYYITLLICVSILQIIKPIYGGKIMQSTIAYINLNSMNLLLTLTLSSLLMNLSIFAYNLYFSQKSFCIILLKSFIRTKLNLSIKF